MIFTCNLVKYFDKLKCLISLESLESLVSENEFWRLIGGFELAGHIYRRYYKLFVESQMGIKVEFCMVVQGPVT